jgi:DNA-binding NarL/FixJ family response regulator
MRPKVVFGRTCNRAAETHADDRHHQSRPRHGLDARSDFRAVRCLSVDCEQSMSEAHSPLTPLVVPHGPLTPREREVVAALCLTDGSTRSIAKRLGIDPQTVKVHLQNIFPKLGVKSRVGLLKWALKQGYEIEEQPA